MAQNIRSLQLLRNSVVKASYQEAINAITGSTTQDGVIKLARYTDSSTDPYSGGTSGNVKTIFGIYHTIGGESGYTIYESYKEVIEAIKEKIDTIAGGGEGSIAQQIKDAIDKLNSKKNAGESEVFSAVYQDSGVTSASTRNLTSVKLGGYAVGTDAKVADTDTLGKALGKLQAQINAMDKEASSGEGEVVVTVVEDDGKVTEQKEKISKVLLNDYVKDTTGKTKADKVAATDSLGTALSKLENQIEVVSANTDDIVSNLTANTVANENKVITDVTQSNGKITATASNLTGVKLDGYAVGTDDSGNVAATDTLGQALGKLQGQINGMDKAADETNGQVVTTVAQADGKVTETKANVKDLQLGGYTKDASATGDIASNDTINAALSKLENKAAAITIKNDDKSINVTTGTDGTNINVNIKSDEHVLAKDGNAGLYTNIAISAITGADLTALGANVKEAYKLVGTDGAKLGTEIKIYKDSSISKIYLGYPTDTVDADSGVITSGTTGEAQSLNYVYHKEDGTYEMVHVDVSKFLAESEFKSGVTADNTGVVHGVVDAASEKDGQATPVPFLTVGENGFKVDGIKNEITRQINLLDVTGDTAQSGKYITHINETDGKIHIEGRADIAAAPLNNYEKGTAPADANSAITATDTINQALAKLEHQVDKAKAAATTKVVEGTDDGNNMTIVPTTSDTDNSVTYTVNLTDVASKAALDAEVTRAKNAEKEIADKVGLTGEESGRTWSVTNATYATGNTVNDSIKNLDTQVKANADAIAANKVVSANSALTVASAATGTTLTVVVDNKAHTVDETTLAVTNNKNDDVVSPIAITSSGIAFADVLDAGFYDQE